MRRGGEGDPIASALRFRGLDVPKNLDPVSPNPRGHAAATSLCQLREPPSQSNRTQSFPTSTDVKLCE